MCTYRYGRELNIPANFVVHYVWADDEDPAVTPLSGFDGTVS
jgi:hypothetical protein